MDLTKILQGKKTYLAVAGLVGLAVYQYTVGDYVGLTQSVLAALSVFGLRSALPRPPAPPPAPPAS